MTSGGEFADFAEAVSPRLRRMALLLCGDWHTAESRPAWMRPRCARCWSALAPEPPIGPVAGNSLRAGIKLRRRRRIRAAAGGAAAVAVIAVAIPVVTGALGHPAARRTKMTARLRS